MSWDEAETGDEYDTGAYPLGPHRTGVGREWAGIAVAVGIIAVIVTVIVVWATHLPVPVPLVANAVPQAVTTGTGNGTGGNAARGTSGPSANTGTVTGPTWSGPLGRVDHAWAAKAAAATGIPDRAFLAYASADLTIEKEQPSCGLGWNTLAAIGTVESANGTYAGATLLADGSTSKPIIGVPLNGRKFGGGTVAAIPARGTGDGWVHAVGPMQFLPSTWAKWGADGNGDGAASLNQIDDAALAAARYLCASGTMTSTEGWRAAVLSYNQSDAYANEVAAIANRYAAAVTGLS